MALSVSPSRIQNPPESRATVGYECGEEACYNKTVPLLHTAPCCSCHHDRGRDCAGSDPACHVSLSPGFRGPLCGRADKTNLCKLRNTGRNPRLSCRLSTSEG